MYQDPFGMNNIFTNFPAFGAFQPPQQFPFRPNAPHPPNSSQPNPTMNHRSTGPPPPTSHRTLSNLTPVPITFQDLQVNSPECSICLVEQVVNQLAIKLPCGHFFHRECVMPWLEKHCTCPDCRYELETDNVVFERERAERMKSYKLRFSRRELNTKSPTELRSLMNQLQVPWVGCLEKKDMMDRLLSSDRIILIDEKIPSYSRSKLRQLPLSELRSLAAQLGVNSSNCFDKRDIIDLLIACGELPIEQDETNGCDVPPPTDGRINRPADFPINHSYPASPEPRSAQSQPHTEAKLPPVAPSPPRPVQRVSTTTHDVRQEAASSPMKTFLLENLQSMSISKLRSILTECGVSSEGCLERKDLIDTLQASNRIRII